MKLFYLYEEFKQIPNTACSNQIEPTIDNLSTTELYCAAHEWCGGFFDKQGMGVAFVLCGQPVQKYTGFDTKDTTLYIKYGKSNKKLKSFQYWR